MHMGHFCFGYFYSERKYLLSKISQMNTLADRKRMGIFCWWLFLFAKKIFGAKGFVDHQFSYNRLRMRNSSF